MLIVSMWETKKLINKTELSVKKIGFTLSYKVLQHVNTKHDLHIVCTANSMYLPAVRKQLHAVLKEAAVDMSLHPEIFAQAIFGEEFIADFNVVKDYAPDAPWCTREKDNKTTSWQKMVYHVEYKEEDGEELLKRIEHSKKLGLDRVHTC